MESAEPVLSDIEETFDAYIQLWIGLERLGVSRVAALGQIIPASDIDLVYFDKPYVVGPLKGSEKALVDVGPPLNQTYCLPSY